MTSIAEQVRRTVNIHPRARKILLACGIVATMLYVLMDLIASLRYDGYSYTGQTISELSAIDAPTRSLWIPLGVVYSLLMIAFGFGAWVAATYSRALRAVGMMAAGVGLLGLVAWPFAPMHQREILAAGGETLADTMHIVLGFVDTLLFMVSIAVGARVFGKRFLYYSIATIVVVLVSGTLTGMEGPKVANDESTPWIGVTERIAVFGSMLWYSVLAAGLLLSHRASTPKSRIERDVAHNNPAPVPR